MIKQETLVNVLTDLTRAARLLSVGEQHTDAESLIPLSAAYGMVRMVADDHGEQGELYRDALLVLGVNVLHRLAMLDEAGVERWEPLIPMNGTETTAVAAVTKACD